MTTSWHRHVITDVLTFLVLAIAVPASAQTDPHAGHQQAKPPASAPQKPAEAAPHQHPSGEQTAPELPPFIPPLTDDDRRAAFPDVEGHTVHDHGVNYFVLFDQFEWQGGSTVSGINLDSRGWVGRDRDRLWFRYEGERTDGRVEEAHADVLYGHQFSRWWDLVVGIRQDFRPGPSQTWAAFGVQGLAPYWFEIEATGYLGAAGRAQARIAVEYDLLLTNRVILQPLFEAAANGKSDPARGQGAGLATTDLGLRLRYEFKRELAPYLGVTWTNKWGKTADFAAAAGEDTGGARLVTGVRLWF
jgi:copper resistance protein B